jgi:hypothetical protein
MFREHPKCVAVYIAPLKVTHRVVSSAVACL